VGNATNDLGFYKITIQQGWPDTTLIVPIELNLNAGKGLIVFDTEMGNQISLKAKLKNEDTDMIRPFTELDTLRNLVKRSPKAMDIRKESDISIIFLFFNARVAYIVLGNKEKCVLFTPLLVNPSLNYGHRYRYPAL
jgi:hypothetical protein